MDQYRSEKVLAIIYPVIIGLSFVCSVTSAVAWTHWKYALDTCGERYSSCGCFLYGLSAITYYRGGHAAYCHLAVYGLVIPVIFAVIFGSYHVYRVCMGVGKHRNATARLKQRSGDMMVITTQSEITYDDISPYYWIPVSVLSALMTLYTLIYISIFTGGIIQSCDQYRKVLLKFVYASGNMVSAIQGRISCAAVFDFMDYLHPDPAPDRRRYDRINSPACYHIAIICGWACVLVWLCGTVTNIRLARSSRTVRV